MKPVQSLLLLVSVSRRRKQRPRPQRLDPGVHDALMGIERLKGDIALKASQGDLNAVKVSIERLKHWAMGAVIAALLAFIAFLLNLLSRLLVSGLTGGSPSLSSPG